MLIIIKATLYAQIIDLALIHSLFWAVTFHLLCRDHPKRAVIFNRPSLDNRHVRYGLTCTQKWKISRFLFHRLDRVKRTPHHGSMRSARAVAVGLGLVHRISHAITQPLSSYSRTGSNSTQSLYPICSLRSIGHHRLPREQGSRGSRDRGPANTKAEVVDAIVGVVVVAVRSAEVLRDADPATTTTHAPRAILLTCRL